MLRPRIFAALSICACAGLLAFTGCPAPRGPIGPGGSSNTTDAESDDAAEAPPAEESPAPPVAKAPGANETTPAVATPAPRPTQAVTLGDPSLTAGIPGAGPLTAEQIDTWLADPKNHEVLDVSLPTGLAAGAQLMKGLAENPLTRAKIELGRQLYFDRRLSADGTVSCADCHHPDEGYARHTQFGVGIGEQQGNRNSPVSYNRILSSVQFWDGRAATLEEQAQGPIANPIEMGNTHETCVATLANIAGYRKQFARIFGDEITIDHVAAAIAAFERAIVTGPSPYDYYEPLRSFENTFKQDLADLASFKEEDPDSFARYEKLKAASDAQPMSDSAKRGREIFFSDKGACTACHAGANFTDELYHNLGVGMAAEKPDLGRFEVTQAEKDRGAFKTPTVRNVALSAPYMHDGSQKTLEEVVEWYAKGGHPNPWLSEKVKKLDLSAQDKQDLVEFMKALTGAFPPVATARLPE